MRSLLIWMYFLHPFFILSQNAESLILPDVFIQNTYRQAATKNILSALNPNVFLGYFSVCADGKGYGYGNTFPSLDGHQMSEALCWLGKINEVLANWDYVKSFQKPNGQLPLAIFPSHGGKMVGSADIKTAVDSNGGYYNHWVPGNPLRALGPVTYIQNADLIFKFTGSEQWLEKNIHSINLAGEYLLTLIDSLGDVGGAGYYLERPLRAEHDGVAQGHAAFAMDILYKLNLVTKDSVKANLYKATGDRIKNNFINSYWAGDRFVEYIHPQKGRIATHGYTDSDWTAIALSMGGAKQRMTVWKKIKTAKAFYFNTMPTGISTIPTSYQKWESSYSDLHDLAAMGRVWYLEAKARYEMKDAKGLLKTIQAVAVAGKKNGYYWYERYNEKGGYGVEKYNEYPANLIRIINGFLLGIQLRYDRSIHIDPLLTPAYWRSGVGQSILTSHGTLNFRLNRKKFEGEYFGSEPMIIRLNKKKFIKKKNYTLEIQGHTTSIVRSMQNLELTCPADRTGQGIRFKLY